MDKGAWQTTVHGVSESDMTEQLSTHNICYEIQDMGYIYICISYVIRCRRGIRLLHIRCGL